MNWRDRSCGLPQFIAAKAIEVAHLLFPESCIYLPEIFSRYGTRKSPDIMDLEN
jgi:hypothetical protein